MAIENMPSECAIGCCQASGRYSPVGSPLPFGKDPGSPPAVRRERRPLVFALGEAQGQRRCYARANGVPPLGGGGCLRSALLPGHRTSLRASAYLQHLLCWAQRGMLLFPDHFCKRPMLCRIAAGGLNSTPKTRQEMNSTMRPACAMVSM